MDLPVRPAGKRRVGRCYRCTVRLQVAARHRAILPQLPARGLALPPRFFPGGLLRIEIDPQGVKPRRAVIQFLLRRGLLQFPGGLFRLESRTLGVEFHLPEGQLFRFGRPVDVPLVSLRFPLPPLLIELHPQGFQVGLDGLQFVPAVGALRRRAGLPQVAVAIGWLLVKRLQADVDFGQLLFAGKRGRFCRRVDHVRWLSMTADR